MTKTVIARAAISLTVILLIATSSFAEVKIEKIDYHGWPDSVRVSNEKACVVIVPQIGGRIMEFSSGGKNAIWVNPAELGRIYPLSADWHNYGGYKTWQAPQTAWGWPPDRYIDQAPAAVQSIGPRSVRITGADSPSAGVRFVKEVTLDPSSPRLRIVQRIINTSCKDVEWGVWDVTQVVPEGRVAFAVNPASKFQNGVLQLHTDPISNGIRQWKVRDGICILEPGKYVEKIGADPNRGWMLWTDGKLVYLKLFPTQKINAIYQDQGSQLELFNAPGPPAYVEMEVSSPIVKLKSGQETVLTEVWMLIPLNQPVKTDDDLLALIKTLTAKRVLR